MADRSRSSRDRGHPTLPPCSADQQQPASHHLVLEKVVVTYDGCFRRRRPRHNDCRSRTGTWRMPPTA